MCWIMGRYAKEKNELYGMEQVALRQKKEMSHFAAQQAILRLEELRSTLHDDGQTLNNWLNEMRRSFMDTAIYSFNRAYKDIMDGVHSTGLFHGTYQTRTLKLLKKATEQFALNSPGVLKLELSAETILSFLLDHFVCAVLYFENKDSANGYVPSTADRKYLALLSANHKDDYRMMRCDAAEERYNLYLRLLMVTDYVSGMTDTYARMLYRKLRGVD